MVFLAPLDAFFHCTIDEHDVMPSRPRSEMLLPWKVYPHWDADFSKEDRWRVNYVFYLLMRCVPTRWLLITSMFSLSLSVISCEGSNLASESCPFFIVWRPKKFGRWRRWPTASLSSSQPNCFVDLYQRLPCKLRYVYGFLFFLLARPKQHASLFPFSKSMEVSHSTGCREPLTTW